MLCDTVRDRLLTADDPARPDADVAGHVAGCAGCSQLVADLARIEAAVRAYPISPSVLARQDAFLAGLTPTPARQVRVRHLAAAFAALAAGIILVVGMVALSRDPVPDGPTPTIALANPEVVEDLVEWNLRLTASEAPAEREQLVRERMPALQAAMWKADLSVDDRAFAEQLLAHGRRLGQAADAVDEAEGFHGLADTLLVRLDTTVEDPTRSVFYSRLYSQVVDRGVDVNLKRAERLSLKAEKQARVQDLRKAKKKQEAQAAALAERMSAARDTAKGGKSKAKGANRPAK